MARVQDYANEHVTAFNNAVSRRDFESFLTRFEDDALMRFENVPGVGVAQFVGRRAFTAGYEEQPPDDQIRIAGAVRSEGQIIVIPFVWLRDGAAGTLRLTLRGNLIARMVVTFD